MTLLAGGILESSGFKIQGNDNEMFLNDDGQGNVRMYYLVSGVKTYQNNTQGTINYTTGQVTLTSLNIASISNIRGSASTVIELTVNLMPNDVIPVRDQILEIDVANSSVTVETDSFASGTSDGGTTYTTTSSYLPLFKEKLSTLLKHQAPDFVLNDHPRFLEFVKQYYTFMESAEISITSIESTDGIQLESETDLTDVLLLDANRVSSNNTTEGNGDKVLQESSSYGKFEKGETITGATSGATASVLVEFK